MMELKVASIQMISENNNITGNMQRAEKFILQAIKKCAKLILLPEFALIGYEYSDNAWAAAETIKGYTYSFLKKFCIENDVYIGTCIFEKDGKNLYDTFILVGPGTDELWYHRKIEPAFYEAFIFAGGGINTDVFDTPLGKIGVAICLDTTKTHTLRSLSSQKLDLLLIPFSFPDFPKFYPKKSLNAWRNDYSRIPQLYCEKLKVPVVSSNKTGSFNSKVPFMPFIKLKTPFLDLSQILLSDGSVIAKTQPGEQLIIEEIDVESSKAPSNMNLPSKRWFVNFTGFVRFTTDFGYKLGKLRYEHSSKCKKAAVI